MTRKLHPDSENTVKPIFLTRLKPATTEHAEGPLTGEHKPMSFSHYGSFKMFFFCKLCKAIFHKGPMILKSDHFYSQQTRKPYKFCALLGRKLSPQVA